MCPFTVYLQLGMHLTNSSMLGAQRPPSDAVLTLADYKAAYSGTTAFLPPPAGPALSYTP